MARSINQYFSDRVLYYASFAIQQQATFAKERLERTLVEAVETGSPNVGLRHWNYAVNRVYVVCVLNYIMDHRYPDKYRWDIVRMDRELKEPFSDTLTEVYLEMPKFRLPLSEGLRKAATNLKRLGMDLQSIVKATGLTESEIQAL